jgi:uncharacterized membrane protein
VTYLGVTIGVCVFETIFSQIIHESGSDQTLASPGFTVDNLYAGFRYIFAILGFLSIVGMIFSYLPKNGCKKKGKGGFPMTEEKNRKFSTSIRKSDYVTYSFLNYTKRQPSLKCRTSIHNKHNSRPTTNIDTTPYILSSTFN